MIFLSRVNFINILHQASMRSDPKSAKKYRQAINLFSLFGSVLVKALCKMLEKLTLDEANF